MLLPAAGISNWKELPKRLPADETIELLSLA
jgi:hypothetical protein